MSDSSREQLFYAVSTIYAHHRHTVLRELLEILPMDGYASSQSWTEDVSRLARASIFTISSYMWGGRGSYSDHLITKKGVVELGSHCTRYKKCALSGDVRVSAEIASSMKRLVAKHAYVLDTHFSTYM